MKPDLFEAIGGRSRINATVDLFYRKVLADPSLRGFFEGANMNGLHTKQAMFLTMLLGGEQRYSGREMGAAHAALRMKGLEPAHFDAFLGHFRAALEESGVAPNLVAHIVSKLENARSAILGTTSK